MHSEEMLLETWPMPTEEEPLPRFSLFFLFSSIIVIGLLLNLLVTYRMIRLARSDRHQFLSGTGVFLLCMAISDSLAMLSSFSQLMASLLPLAYPFHQILCACAEWTWRVSFCLSMYSWLCMSSLRYVAALRPLQYSTLGRGPLLALSGVAILAVTLNLHLLVSTKVSTQDVCVIQLNATTSIYGFVDVLLTFVVPFVIILSLDVRVLLCRPDPHRSGQPLLVFPKADDDVEKKRTNTMRRFMLITLVHLVLCCPDNFVRALRMLYVDIQPLVIHLSRSVCFIKFSFNAFYLTAFVFDRNVASKQSSSRALSISIRRLEDQPSIIPRGRANTVSFRSPTPQLPVLTRNSSCICLDSVLDFQQPFRVDQRVKQAEANLQRDDQGCHISNQMTPRFLHSHKS